MKETDIQKHVIDVVRERGGAAFKLSNQFSVGVADLLVKIPDNNKPVTIYNRHVPAMLVEVKLHRGWCDNGATFTLDVTVPQRQFLQRFNDAGMRTGVLSFLYKGNKAKMCGRMFTLDELERARYRVATEDHPPLGDHETRGGRIFELLRDYANG